MYTSASYGMIQIEDLTVLNKTHCHLCLCPNIQRLLEAFIQYNKVLALFFCHRYCKFLSRQSNIFLPLI